MNNLKIKDPEKLLELMQKPDGGFFDSCGGCPFITDYDIFKQDCILFGEELEFDEDYRILRCKQCLECYEVENEN